MDLRNSRYGDSPYIKRGAQIDPQRLFYSDEKIALKKMISLVGGYGFLKAGTIVGVITESTSRKGRYVPYAIQTAALALPFLSGAYLLADGSNGTTLNVTLEDSYKFAVGDHIAGVDSDATPIDIGAITAIDRTTYHYAVITTASVDTSALTVAAAAFIFIQTQLTTPWTNAVGVLVEGVDTGVGVDAVGAQAGMVLSNAILYRGLLPNYDSGALTDLGGVVDGQHLILK